MKKQNLRRANIFSKLAVFALLNSLLVAASFGAQPTISVNFDGCCSAGAPTALAPTEVAGLIPLDNWNSLNGNNIHDRVLTNSAGVATTVTIFFDADESWASGTGTGTPDHKMMNGYLGISNGPDSNSGQGNYRPIFLNSVPDGAYKLIMYNVQDGQRPNGYTVNADTINTLHITHEGAGDWNGNPTFRRAVSTNVNARDVGNYVQFDEVQPIGGTITIDCRAESFRGVMNGLQLIPVPAGAFRVINQPQSFAKLSGQSVSFISTVVDGVAPVTYAWLTNGVVDPSVTGTTWTKTAVARDNGRTFQLVATDAASISVTSRLATLSVPQIYFTAQPASASVVASLPTGPTVTFTSAVADGDLPPSFTWYTNGVVDPTATGSSYTRTNIRLSENGRTFYVVATDAGGTSVTSSTATLTVVDVFTLNSASALNDPNGVYASFSHPLDPVTALNAANYSIPGLTISGATFFGANSNVVRLAVNSMSVGSSYTVTATGIMDQSAASTAPNPGTATFTFGVGINPAAGLTLKRFNGANTLVSLRNAINNCTTPTFTDPNQAVMSYFPNLDNYGTWMYGQFKAPTTGNYQFQVAGDDNVQLFLSTDASPANKVLIAQQSAWGSTRDYAEPNQGGTVTAPSAMIPLVAGQTYYLELLHQEGGGGDHVEATVRLPGGPAIVDNAPDISRNLFATNYSVGCPPNYFIQNLGPIAILNGAQSQTVFELATASFKVVLDGSPAYNIQWFSNSVAIPGATNANYSFNPLRYANGAVYHAVVNNDFSSATSASSTLTVISDEIAPTLVKAVGAAYRTNASVVFSEPVGVSSGTTLANYSITNSAGAALAISDAVISPDGKVVTLGTAVQTPGEQYGVVVNNVVDRAGVPNTNAPNSVALFTATDLNFFPGNVLFRAYPAGGGNALSTLTSHPTYPNSPDFFTAITAMRSRLAVDPNNPTFYQADGRESYGATIAGHFIPPTSGNWIFYVSADDDGGLVMNTNGATRTGSTQVRFAPGCCRALSAGADPTAPLSLIAGQAYYIEAQYKEGGGGDYVEIGARLAGDNSAIVPIGANRLAFGFNLLTTLNPTNFTVVQNHLASFTAAGTVGGVQIAPQYQWQRSEDNTGASFTNIPGATTAAYSYYAPLGDNGIQFKCAIFVPGLQTNLTTAAILTVLADDQPPAIASVRALTPYKIEITFSERLELGATSTEDNYLVNTPAGEILAVGGSAVQSADQLRVTFDLTAALPCDYITVSAFNVTDEAGNFADLSASFLNYIPFGMKHRYNFNNLPGNANGATAYDSVAGANGVVQGGPVTFTGSRVVLTGGSSATAPYVDLPNYMLSTNSAANGGSGKVTLEGWVKVTGNQAWSRIFDFGDSLGAEVFGPGGGGEGRDYFFYSAQINTDVNARQTESRNETSLPAAGTGGTGVATHPTTQFNQMSHFAVTWDESNGQVRTYENGVLVSSFTQSMPMSQLNDVNVWLGRSAWNGDQNLQGEFDEFRVYNRLLSTTEMAANIAIGPDNDLGTPLAIRLVIPTTNMVEQSSQQAQVFGDFSNKSNVNLTVSRCYTLVSSAPGVVTTTPDAILQAVGGGTSTLTVSLGGVSSSVDVNVALDVTAPTVTGVRGVRTLNAVKVTFDSPVSVSTATEIGNYLITDTNGNPLNITGALTLSGQTVTIPTDLQPPGTVYNIEISGVTDLALTPNEMTLTNVPFQAWILSRGFAYLEYYTGINGGALGDLTNNPAYPNSPSTTGYNSFFESTRNDDNYGTRITAIYTPPVAGNYVFYVSSDDQSVLYLSTDATPANKVELAVEPEWAGSREFIYPSGDCCGRPGNYRTNGIAGPNPLPRNTSTNIALVSATQYYIEMVHKEGGGGDNASAAAQYPGGPAIANGSEPINGTFLTTLADPVGASITIQEQPIANTNVTTTAALNVVAVGTNVNGSAPVLYQWQVKVGSNWVDILGANNGGYTATATAGQCTKFRALIFIPGASAVSAVATVCGPAVLTITPIDAITSTLSWAGGGILQESSSITGPWTDSASQSNPQTVTTSSGTLFFKLR